MNKTYLKRYFKTTVTDNYQHTVTGTSQTFVTDTFNYCNRYFKTNVTDTSNLL